MTASFHPARAAAAAALAALTALLAAGAGCQSARESHQRLDVVPADIPRELTKVSLPDYRVEPPDILVIEAVRAVPRPPYLVQPQDVLFVAVPPLVQGDQPVSGNLNVDTDGTIDLGPQNGGPVQVAGLSVPQIREAVAAQVTLVQRRVKKLEPAEVSVSLAQSQASQRITGPHLIRPDGTISLATYGSIRVAGLTLAEVRRAVEARLAESLQDPVVTVDVQSYNSKLVYVIFDGAGAGQSIYRLPVTGNDTVLDAIAQVNGLTAVSDVNRIWVTRPSPAGAGHQILPVDWRAVTECGDSATNYQLMPGDRVFVGAVPLIGLDVRMARLFAPVERVLGVTLLGTSVVRQIKFISNGNNNGLGGGGGLGSGLGGIGF